MQVISGKYKGRKLNGYNQITTRPTANRIKESVFSMIQNYVKGTIVLDLFAGSGSLGIEALSNGCLECYFVEKDKKMANILLDNITKLKIENYNIIKDDYLNALKKLSQQNIKFDLVFLDPPYNLHFINNAITKLIELDLLNKNAFIICEYDQEEINNNNFTVINHKEYGYKKITILKRR